MKLLSNIVPLEGELNPVLYLAVRFEDVEDLLKAYGIDPGEALAAVMTENEKKAQ
jgi:hypothetical protein